MLSGFGSINLPCFSFSHLDPVYELVQLHLIDAPKIEVQVAPFKQGFEAHRFLNESQFFPVYRL
jgi:hypothetical protein